MTPELKSLDAKLTEIKANRSSRAFIIADAKDADMAFGVRAPGPRGFLAKRGSQPAKFSPEVWSRDEFGYRNLPEFLDIIREITNQGLVDIMLMSAYVNEQLAIKEGLFKNTHVTALTDMASVTKDKVKEMSADLKKLADNYQDAMDRIKATGGAFGGGKSVTRTVQLQTQGSQ